ncbi:RND superfamily putative drug exporter [Leifsonia sp. AK011]|uniref:MMPL family transporter n=1 Tax=Leifsonia sp. AK011 TaxID=2723075 RepID=UPI0015CA5799|nr:efflux RND transporter permease subunit [Leifsonia sp. AK011]NYF09636.1 RND superfamily putative drug exporter [Leifsonia sp. AK011]
MLASLGRFAARRRILVLVVWGVLFVAGLALSGVIFDNASEVPNAPTGAESLQVATVLDELSPEGETIIAVIEGEDFFDPALVASASDVLGDIRYTPGVVEVVDAYTGGGLTSDDQRSSLVVIELDQSLTQDEALELATTIRAKLHTIEPAEVLVGGELLSEQAFVDSAITGAAIGEGGALVILIVLLVIVLGGLRIGVLPVATALLTIVTALLVLSGVIEIVAVNEFAVNVITILGLGLAVDYSLLVISRFRDERQGDDSATVEELLARTVQSAGRAVLVSGLVVCISLVGMLLLGDPLLSGMAVGGAIAVLLATLAGVTFVPAYIAVVHRHIPAPGTRTWSRRWVRSSDRPRLLARLAASAQRRPVITTIASTVVLLILAAPLTTLTLGSSDIRSLPVGAEERQAYEATTTRFSELGVEPVTVLVDAGFDASGVSDLFDTIAALPGVIDAESVADLPPDVAAVDFTPAGDATGSDAQALVRDIRSLDSSVPFRVGGPAAELVDTIDHLVAMLPIAGGVVLVATFALLFALTRSIVIPIKTLLLNTLTIAATLGVVVAVFQWGWGAGVLGFAPWGAVDATTPLLIGLLAFGLSMDYAVFLLARIHEYWRARDPKVDPRVANDRAVLAGISASGPVVTLAALSIAIVFLGFAVGNLLAMKEVGIGMLVAVILDVTLIRGLLLPALMTLLGRWNWWAPAFGRTKQD